MTTSVRFHPLATAEVVAAQLWYADRVAGLGDRFVNSLRRATDRAASWPNVGTPTIVDEAGHAVERRLGVPGFPYVVVFRVDEVGILVLAVHHERRRPVYWADRRS